MTRSEKKQVIESMAEQFMSVGDNEGKSMIIMVMSAYMEGESSGQTRGTCKMGTSAEETGACGTVFLVCRNGAAVAPSMTGWRPDILTMASRETKSVIP